VVIACTIIQHCVFLSASRITANFFCVFFFVFKYAHVFAFKTDQFDNIMVVCTILYYHHIENSEWSYRTTSVVGGCRPVSTFGYPYIVLCRCLCPKFSHGMHVMFAKQHTHGIIIIIININIICIYICRCFLILPFYSAVDNPVRLTMYKIYGDSAYNNNETKQKKF